MDWRSLRSWVSSWLNLCYSPSPLAISTYSSTSNANKTKQSLPNIANVHTTTQTTTSDAPYYTMTMFTSATPIPAEASESGHSLPTPSRPKWIAQMDYDPPEPSEDFRKILPENYPTHKTREIHVIRDLNVRERLGEKFHTAFLKVYEKLALKVNGDMILHTYFDPSAGPPVVFTASGDFSTFFMDCEARIHDQVAQTTGPSMYILRMSLVIDESGNGVVSAVSYYELAPIPGEVVRGRYKFIRDNEFPSEIRNLIVKPPHVPTASDLLVPKTYEWP